MAASGLRPFDRDAVSCPGIDPYGAGRRVAGPQGGSLSRREGSCVEIPSKPNQARGQPAMAAKTMRNVILSALTPEVLGARLDENYREEAGRENE